MRWPRLLVFILVLIGIYVLSLRGLVRAGEQAYREGRLADTETWLSWANRLGAGTAAELTLAECLIQRGDFRSAQRLLSELDAWQEGEPYRARWLHGKAAVARAQGQSDRAAELYAEAAHEARRHGNPQLEVRSLLGEAEAHFAGRGQLDLGEARIRQAARVASRFDSPALEAEIFSTLGKLSWSYRRDRRRAPEQLNQALELFRRAEDLRGEAWTLSRIGLVHLASRELDQHAALQNQAKMIFERIGDRAGQAAVRSYVGAMHATAERYPEAEHLYASARASYEDLGSVVGVRALDFLLASLEIRTGQLERARDRVEHLLLDEGPTMERRRQISLLGDVLLHQGNPNAAIESYQLAANLDQELDHADHALRLRDLTMLGHASLQSGQIERARELFHRRRSQAIESGDQRGLAVAELAMADLLDREGHFGEALQHLEAASRLQAAQLDTVLAPFFETQFWQALDRLCHLLFERELRHEDRLTAIDISLRLLELMRLRAYRSPDRQAGEKPLPKRQLFDRRALQRSLDDRSTVIAYAFGGEKVFAIAIDRTHTAAVLLPLDKEQIEDRVRLLVAKLADPDDESWTTLAIDLRRVLLEPLERAGLKRGGRLALIPIGFLHDLPFASLSRKEPDGRRIALVDDWQLVVSPSASSLVPRTFSKRTGQQIASFSFASGSAPLLQAQSEAKTFATRLGGRVQSGIEATESAVRRALSESHTLHLAVHGIAEPEIPLRSRLLLAPDEQHDGELTAQEILEIDVSSELVILSGCRTGLGFPSRADDWTGVDRIGLAEALLQAGAGQVVASLLPVQDLATRALIEAFAEELAISKDPVASLSKVQRRMARESHPSTWAGFQLMGQLRSGPSSN